jgi:hypothetical protein
VGLLIYPFIASVPARLGVEEGGQRSMKHGVGDLRLLSAVTSIGYRKFSSRFSYW